MLKPMEFIHGNTHTFVYLAFNNCAIEKRLRCIIKDNKAKMKTLSEGDDKFELFAINSNLYRKLIGNYYSTILFTAFALESYINTFGELKLPKDVYETFLEKKLELVDKWLMLPKICNDYSFDKSLKPYNLLKKVVKARNYLAHDKPKKVSTYNEIDQLDTEMHKSLNISAPECIELIVLLDFEMNIIDVEYHTKSKLISDIEKLFWSELKDDNLKYEVVKGNPLEGTTVYSLFEYFLNCSNESQSNLMLLKKIGNDYGYSDTSIVLKKL